MFSHGFMSFAAVGVTVACLLIMGTFTLVAYNANENLADLQQENAVLAFVDDSLTEREAKALQTKLEKVDNVADCTFMSRDEAKENYIEKYDGDELYGDLPADVFRHRYVIHVTDPDRIMETKTAVEQVTGIAKARDDMGRADRRAGNVGDRIFLPGRSNPLPLRDGSAELLFLQHIRDTAHHFVIGRHRRARAGAALSAELLRIPGVGKATARLLWDHFKALDAIIAATPAQLAAIPGIGPRKAEALAGSLKRLKE